MTEWRSILRLAGWEASDEGNLRVDNGFGGFRYPSIYVWHDSRGGKDRRRVYVLGVKRDVAPLICEAFHGVEPDAKHKALHWDGNSLNDVASNLRWGTAKDNAEDGIRLNEVLRGSRHSRAILNENEAFWIKQAKGKIIAREIAAILGVSKSCIEHVWNRDWRHV